MNIFSGIVDIFNLIFMGPVVNLLVLIYQGLQNLHVPGALGFSIMILTILIRILVWPFMSSQIKATKKMSDLKPHLDNINKLLYFPTLKLPSTLDPNFFGLNLGIKPSEFGTHGMLLLLIPLITALLTFVQSKMAMPKPVKKYPSDSPKEKKEKESM